MFKKILLAYDGSDTSAGALDKTIELARAAAAEVYLVGIARSDAPVAYSEPYALDYFASERAHVEQSLLAASKKMREQGVNASIAIREGYPANEIATEARIVMPDLLVIGHTDKGLLARWFEGSVGAHLINNLPCNLLIVTDA